MTVRFINNWGRLCREDGTNPFWSFVLFNVWWSRYDARGFGCATAIGVSQSLGFTILNYGAEVTW